MNERIIKEGLSVRSAGCLSLQCTLLGEEYLNN